MKSLILASVFAVISAQSSAAPAETILRDLSACDATFFSTLTAQKTELSDNSNFHIKAGLGYFDVLDRGDAKLAIRTFDKSLTLGKLQATAYFDEFSEPKPKAFLIYWGFLIKAPLKEVVAATKSSIRDNKRLRQDGEIYIRSEVWKLSDASAGWQKVDTVSDQMPAEETVERVLLLEPYENDPTLTRFGCSLQGSVTPEMLRSERPDLNP